MTEMEKTDLNLNQNAFKSILNAYRFKANNNNNMLARSVVIKMVISGECCCFVVD